MQIYIALGFYWPIRVWLLGGLVSLILLVRVTRQHLKGLSDAALNNTQLGSIFAVWTLAAFGIWYLVCSAFSSKPTFAAAYAATTWWLLWAWLMFFVGWYWSASLRILAALFLIVIAFLVSIRFIGHDGDRRPMIVWRLGSRPLHQTTLPTEESQEPVEASFEETITEGSYPRFRGANGLATVHGANLDRDWQAHPPMMLWKHDVGAGWGAFAIDGGLAITQEQRGEEECVACYDRNTGRELWVHRDAAHYANPGTGDGPRATPTIDGQTIYALGATGILNCLDRKTGKARWSLNIVQDTEMKEVQPHGAAGSPLVVDNVVVVCPGGAKDDAKHEQGERSLIAYDKETGKRVWHAGADLGSYTSPLLVELDGTKQVLIVNADNVNAHDPANGKVLWTFAFRNDQQTNCSQPYPVDANHVFLSTDYGKGCALVELAQQDSVWNVTQNWSSRTMQTKFCSALVHDGYAYGMDDGILECVSLKDGKRRWKRGRYGHGQLMLVDDLLLIQCEDARVILVEANPQAHRELGSIEPFEGKTWNNPALAGRQLFVRSDREAACYELSVTSDAPSADPTPETAAQASE